jgi:hypothetical protein
VLRASALHRVVLLPAAVLAMGSAAAQEGEPLHVRNLNPLVAIFGLPAWDTAVHGTRLGATLELANHFRFSERGTDALSLDGETLRTTVSFDRGFADDWFFGVELPYYRVSGGILDNPIDAWHSFFRLPDEGRNNRPENALLFELANANGRFFLLDHAVGGVGDVQVKLGRAVGRGDRFVVEGTLKLPTGDENMLAGSGSADASLTVLRSQALTVRGRPAGYYWGAGVLFAGDPKPIAFPARHWVYTGVVGGSWRLRPRLGLKAQLDFHSRFYDSALPEIGQNAVEATVGGWLRRGRRTVLDFAVVEDLRVSTAPDVVVQTAVHWQW